MQQVLTSRVLLWVQNTSDYRRFSEQWRENIAAATAVAALARFWHAGDVCREGLAGGHKPRGEVLTA